MPVIGTGASPVIGTGPLQLLCMGLVVSFLREPAESLHWWPNAEHRDRHRQAAFILNLREVRVSMLDHRCGEGGVHHDRH